MLSPDATFPASGVTIIMAMVDSVAYWLSDDTDGEQRWRRVRTNELAPQAIVDRLSPA